MVAVRRLVTVVDVAEDPYDDAPLLDGPAPAGARPGLAPPGVPRPPDPRRMSVDALLMAELEDGRRVTVLDDRGWTASGPVDIWRHTTIEDLADTARTVVGPDEPFDDQSAADMAARHWQEIARRLGGHGVEADSETLARLPHDVELSARVRARINRP